MIRNNNPTPPEATQFNPEIGRPVSRRAALKAFGIGVLTAVMLNPETARPAIAKMGEVIRPVATGIGEGYDTLLSLETLLTPREMVPLEPRETDTPIVRPQRHGEPTAVDTHYTRHGETTTLHFDENASLRAEHTNIPIEDTEFTAAGTAIITTAEGLKHGEQAYCQLFSGEHQTVAVGYEGGLYAYEPALGSEESQGEWVRIVTSTDQDTLSSHAMSTASWEDLESTSPTEQLVKKVARGSKTQRDDLGYKPFGVILSSTRMPQEKESTFLPEEFAQSPQEILDATKRYFLTEGGVVIDLHHLAAKAGETLGLFAQLLSQQISGEAHPTATVRYSTSNDAAYIFDVEPASLEDETITNTTSSLMDGVTALMEGISQRYVVEKMPFLEEVIEDTGMSHEDMFTNTLGINGMLALVKEDGLIEKLRQSLRVARRQYPTMSPEEISTSVVEELKPQLVSQVLSQTAKTYGTRTFNKPITATLPRGIYSHIPVQIDSENSASPTRIAPLLRTAGITIDNPKVRFTTTNVSAVKATVGHALGRAGL